MAGPEGSTGSQTSTAAGEEATSEVGASGEGESSTGSELTSDDATSGGSACGNGVVEPGEFCFLDQLVSTESRVQCFEAADYDADGNIDLLVTHQNGAFVMRGNGDGGFGDLQTLEVGSGGHPGCSAVDVNGDGRPDPVVASQEEQELVSFESSGASFSFAPGVVHEIGDDARTLFPAVLGSSGAAKLISLNFGDEELRVHGVLGNGALPTESERTLGDEPVGGVAADLDGDGDDEVVVALGGGQEFLVLPSSELGSLGEPLRAETGAEMLAIAAVDLDGQLGLDLVFSVATPPRIQVAYNQGDGAFDMFDIIAAPTVPVSAQPDALAVGDFDRDGLPDIVMVSRADDALHWLAGDGTELGEPQLVEMMSQLDRPKVLAVADFNADGVPDVAVGGHHGVVLLLSNP